MSLVAGIDSVGITVADLDRSVDFYTRVLAFTVDSRMEITGPTIEAITLLPGCSMRVARLHLGEEMVELTEHRCIRGRPMPPDSQGNDGWFQHIAIIVADMDEAYRRLVAHGVRAASLGGPQTLPAWNHQAGGIRAYYFFDPDQHFLEVLQFPPDKGDRRWHEPSAAIFRGIDHTAIVVRDTPTSMRYYRDVLGLAVAGTSENHGPEQEALNGVADARLRITTLRPPRGPGVELLEYLRPGPGRPMPGDSRVNDLWHWQTRVSVAGSVRETALQLGKGPHGSQPAVVSFSDDRLGFPYGMLARDPDGHALLLGGPIP